MSKIAPPPGVSDIFPDEAPAWLELENAARKVFGLYGFGELRTPIFEFTEVFQRGLGGETEVVQKEMYTFEDRGGRSLTLRPEGTAGVMRAMAATDAANGVEHRVFYMGPMFRGERPAAGRKRQFHQVGVENVGRAASPGLDAEAIAMLCHFLNEIGISDFELHINTRGVQSDRPAAEQALREHFRPHLAEMCEDCRNRIDRNVWRILDCKQACCRQFVESAPDPAQFFSDESRAYFRKVCDMLTEQGIKFTVDPRLVRGLDYYVHTVFELTHTGLGAQNAIAGGGRYELLLPELKKPIPGVGFAAGMERLLIARESLGVKPPQPQVPKLYLASLGDAAQAFNTALAAKLRHADVSVALDYDVKSMKSQMRAADRMKAEYVLVIGDTELEAKSAKLKRMADGQEIPVELTLDGIISVLNADSAQS